MSQFPAVGLVEANARFTRANIEGQNTLLAVVYVQRLPEAQGSTEDLREQLTQTIQGELSRQYANVTPLVDIVVLE